MSCLPRRGPRAALSVLALLLLAASPTGAAAGPLLDQELSSGLVGPMLLAAPPPASPDLSLDFDLLGKAPPPKVKIDDEAMKRRADLLGVHQRIGIGLAALTVATVVVGQLNYSDKYGSNAPVTGKWEATHTVLSFTTLGVFAVDGTIALVAPGNPVKRDTYDRVTVHKVGMALATAGMIAQGVVGVYADQQEGRIDQAGIAKTHLVIGYATLAAMAVAIGALVF
jgi:cytochrome b561